MILVPKSIVRAPFRPMLSSTKRQYYGTYTASTWERQISLFYPSSCVLLFYNTILYTTPDMNIIYYYDAVCSNAKSSTRSVSGAEAGHVPLYCSQRSPGESLHFLRFKTAQAAQTFYWKRWILLRSEDYSQSIDKSSFKIHPHVLIWETKYSHARQHEHFKLQ